MENTTSIYTSTFLLKGLYYKARVIDIITFCLLRKRSVMKYNSTISDVTRAYVLLLGKEKKYSCRVIAKKANISKSSVSLIL